jgi:hypothetical protein
MFQRERIYAVQMSRRCIMIGTIARMGHNVLLVAMAIVTVALIFKIA